MTLQTKVLVTGAGGFIGHHLTKYLINRGYWVRGVDIKEPEYEPTCAHEFELLDLTLRENCLEATRGVDHVYGLAANMGGIGFIESHKAEIVRDSSLMNLHSIEAARLSGRLSTTGRASLGSEASRPSRRSDRHIPTGAEVQINAASGSTKRRSGWPESAHRSCYGALVRCA